MAATLDSLPMGTNARGSEHRAPTRVLIVGGGCVGVYAALALRRSVRRGRATVTLVNPESFMVYQSFLPEAAAGSIEPRHVVVPLRPVLRHARLLTGWVVGLDHGARVARIQPTEGDAFDVAYDVVVIGVGSISRTLPIPGLAERGVGFKTLGEAIYLRNQLLARMDAAESTSVEAVRRRALTFVFVGGGYAGVEAMAELEDFARDAARYYQTVQRRDMRWLLVDAAPRILPELGGGLADYALERLRRRDIEVHLSTRLESAEGGVVRLSDGTTVEADTLVWTAGVRAHPLAMRLGFPVDDRGRIEVDEFLRVRGVEGAWAAGDCAAVPDLITGGTAPPTAQHALREARRLGRNLADSLVARPPRAFRYRSLGGLATLGLYQGVARIPGVRLRGFPAWFLHRTYHVLRVPTLNRKVRIVMDWTVALFFRRDVAQLGSLQHPRTPFQEATDPPRGPFEIAGPGSVVAGAAEVEPRDPDGGHP
jgi:NADH:quinone reductase (non-electrogenic)